MQNFYFILFFVCSVIDSVSAFFSEQCRQAKISYTGTFNVDICFQYDDGPIIRESFNFGQLPIMLQVSFFVILIMFYIYASPPLSLNFLLVN